jgi:phenylacetic acid degradation operon negative regulatory protein
METGAMVRPQALVLTLLGRHVLERDVAVSTGTFLDVLDRLGVSTDAGRSTLTRMVRRGFLDRCRSGRRTYFSLTDRTRRLLTEGRTRIFVDPIASPEPADTWTLLSFSLPESRRRERHSLRVGLAWRGFGLLRDGLWLAAGKVDVSELVEALGLQGVVQSFVGHPLEPTDLTEVVRESWDLDAIRAHYETFLRRWDVSDPLPAARDDLARELLLITDWRYVLREDPHVPLAHLPEDWPSPHAQRVFQALHERYSPPAEAIFVSILEAIEVPAPAFTDSGLSPAGTRRGPPGGAGSP